MKKYVLDTNVLLQYPESIDIFHTEESTVLLNSAILEELDGLKKAEGKLGYQARQVIKKLESVDDIEYETQDIYSVPRVWDENKRDNKIIMLAHNHDAILVSNDLNVRLKAHSIDVITMGYRRSESDYKGYVEVEMSHEELSEFYSSEEKENKWGLNVNEYLLIKENDKVVDVWKYTEYGFETLNYPKKIQSSLLGVFKSKDVYQNCVLDGLYNSQMVMIKGKAGSGKSLLALSYAMAQIEKGKYDKLIVVTNPVSTRDSAKLGYYPGSKNEKLLDSQTGNMLASKFGDRQIVEDLIRLEKLVLLPLSDIRGYDTTGMKAIVYIMEAQNLNIDLIKLAIQRVGDDGQLIIDGDYKQQVDLNAYSGNENGMKRVSEVFRGQDFYSEVELNNIYRSKLAEIADKL
jgi:predicted ribonuclease YlaK